MTGVVLLKRDFREHDRIVSIYTKEKGKLELLAVGIKKITSKNAAHLEPFSVVDIRIAQGKELDRVASVWPIDSYRSVRKDVRKSMIATFVAYLTDKLVETSEPDENIFYLLKNFFDYLNDTERVNIFLIDSFAMMLIELLGFGSYISENKLHGRKIFEFDASIRDSLEILLRDDWDMVNSLQIQENEKQMLHSIIYEYILFHVEKKVEDWGILEKLI